MTTDRWVTHDHTITFPFTTGSDWLRVVLVAGAILVIAAAILRPFVSMPDRSVQLTVTGTAAGVALVLLLLADGLDMPDQVVVLSLVALTVPMAVTRHPPGSETPIAMQAHRVAPWLVTAAAIAAGVEFSRAWLVGGGNPAETRALTYTSVLIGLIGMSWLVLCRTQSRRTTTATHVSAWGLANTVLAGLTSIAATGIPQ